MVAVEHIHRAAGRLRLRTEALEEIHDGVLAIAAIHPSPPAVAIAVDDEPVPLATVAEWLAAELDVTLPADPSPDKQATGKRCRNSELKDMGWEPAYPTFREGYRLLLANI